MQKSLILKACQEAHYDPNAFCPYDETQIIYAYKGGECRQFDALWKAELFSDNTEIVTTSNDLIVEWELSQENKQKQVHTLWFSALKDTYVSDAVEAALSSKVSRKVFNLCYTEVLLSLNLNKFSKLTLQEYGKIEAQLSRMIVIALKIQTY